MRDVNIENDALLARQLEASNKKEEAEFKNLQERFGYNDISMEQQAEKNLSRAVQRGEISVVDYHERRVMLRVTEKDEIDDGSSVTRGNNHQNDATLSEFICILQFSVDVIPRLRTLCTSASNVQQVWLCSPMDHYAGSITDTGFGCGYR